MTASRWWLIHYPDRDPVEVDCWPEATHADILERHPDAIAAEPANNTDKLMRKRAVGAGLKLAPVGMPSTPMTASEESAIRAWLALIEETDPETITEVIGRCQRDADARDYFIGWSRELATATPDDRRTCPECANLPGRVCLAAKRGEIVSSRNYEPIRDLPRRCEGYAPGAADTDRRPGWERWPGLIQKGGE